MPVNFLELRSQIDQMGAGVNNMYQRHEELLDQAQELLRLYGDRNSILGQLVEDVLKANPRLRCAVPTHEPLTLAAGCPPAANARTILAADGSQVNPSRHDPIPFCVINVGAILLAEDKSQAPQEFTRTKLLYHDELITPQGMLTEGYVALRRDLSERKMLAELSRQYPAPIIALTDGPLELFHEAHESAAFRAALNEYIDSLQDLEKMGVATAGYVDKPFGDLVVRLLELTLFARDEFQLAGRKRPLLGVRDEQLFKTRLAPGQRSAVFSIQSQQAQRFKDGLALHFFYLNIGRPERPAIARVEVPAWVIAEEGLINLLHAALMEQCAQMGANPYPYVLHRAHEIALVSLDEKQKIENMIALEYLNHGVPLGDKSYKQSNKDLSSNRTRYQT